MTVYQELTAFRWIGLLEGISYLALLGIAMPLKYAAGMPLAVTYTGWAHGFLFVVYFVALAWVGLSLKWSFGQLCKYSVAALLPLGPFLMDKHLKQQLEAHKS